jgi:hypothetical protein
VLQSPVALPTPVNGLVEFGPAVLMVSSVVRVQNSFTATSSRHLGKDVPTSLVSLTIALMPQNMRFGSVRSDLSCGSSINTIPDCARPSFRKFSMSLLASSTLAGAADVLRNVLVVADMLDELVCARESVDVEVAPLVVAESLDGLVCSVEVAEVELPVVLMDPSVDEKG